MLLSYFHINCLRTSACVLVCLGGALCGTAPPDTALLASAEGGGTGLEIAATLLTVGTAGPGGRPHVAACATLTGHLGSTWAPAQPALTLSPLPYSPLPVAHPFPPSDFFPSFKVGRFFFTCRVDLCQDLSFQLTGSCPANYLGRRELELLHHFVPLVGGGWLSCTAWPPSSRTGTGTSMFPCRFHRPQHTVVFHFVFIGKEVLLVILSRVCVHLISP